MFNSWVFWVLGNGTEHKQTISDMAKSLKMTVHIPDELLAEFKKEFPEVNVAEVARRVVIKKVEELEKVEKLKAEGKL